MNQDMGASSDEDRAATPSEPSPTVSGIAGIPCAETARDERRLKMAAELTLQRRIQEHARDRAKRELEHAQNELRRIDADFMRYVVNDFRMDFSVAKEEENGPA